MELDTVLWSGLPLEMVERVMSFLPVLDLCRYCSVCKTWNAVIRSPEFGALCAQSAAKRDPSFIAIRSPLGRSKEIHEGWCFFDLDARRWYTVRDDHPKLPKPIFGCSAAITDGGLSCRYLNSITIRESVQRFVPSFEAQRFTIMVYNPLAKALKVLPRVPGHLKSSSYAALHLVVDSRSQQFKIFLINQHVCASSAPDLKVRNDPLMRIYDSATNGWQGSTNPFCVAVRGVGAVSSTVMFQGLLYALFGSCQGFVGGRCETIEQELWRYSLVQDAWERVDANIAATLCSIKLFVSANRLFLIGWLFDKSLRSDAEQWRLEVSEIRAPGTNLERLLEMSKADVVALFDVKPWHGENPEIVASGFGNSILLICKSSQKMMVLDLETRLWEQLPANPAWTPPGDDSYFHFESHFANPVSHMNFILPSSLWWQEGEGAADRDQIRIEPSLRYPEMIELSD